MTVRTGRRTALCLAACLALSANASAQARFFRSDTTFTFTLRTDLRALSRDRDTANSPWHEATLTWAGTAGPQTVALRVRTRGAFRLQHCDLPPIRLRFVNDSVRGTPWHDLHRPKLTTYCRNNTVDEQNVLHEYTLYKVQRLFTPLSYSARLVRVRYEDASGRAQPVTRYGFITEDPDDFAERVRGAVLRPGIRQSQLQVESAAFLGVWQYFIGNTDWSVPSLHNVALVRVDSVIRAVAYDFDWSGAVDAPYAHPAPQLRIHSVRDRVYRGLCLTPEQLEPVLLQFEALKDSIAAVYRRVPDLSPRLIDRTLAWYGEFYREIADRQRFVQRAVLPTCYRQ